MGGLFLNYLSNTFDNLWKENVTYKYIYAIMSSENDVIVGGEKDLLGVCEGIVWVVTS